ncbi:hypothetical protein PHISP_06266 [Aspergillus sp. HF37]|nr:hypothetical protein PHISP_06266 [Aspergillus sp. HF37]
MHNENPVTTLQAAICQTGVFLVGPSKEASQDSESVGISGQTIPASSSPVALSVAPRNAGSKDSADINRSGACLQHLRMAAPNDGDPQSGFGPAAQLLWCGYYYTVDGGFSLP